MLRVVSFVNLFAIDTTHLDIIIHGLSKCFLKFQNSVSLKGYHISNTIDPSEKNIVFAAKLNNGPIIIIS